MTKEQAIEKAAEMEQLTGKLHYALFSRAYNHYVVVNTMPMFGGEWYDSEGIQHG